MELATRPPLRRIVVIDRAVREGQYPNSETLARELEVAPRTIQRDIEFMRDSLLAPLGFSRRKNGYYYTSTQYRLPWFQLTEGELVALFLAGRLLYQYRGTPYHGHLRSAFGKITQFLPDNVSINLGELAESLSVTPTAVALQDIATFQCLATAVQKRQRLEVDYWSVSQNRKTQRTVDPYHLTLIDADWYLIAYCHFRKELIDLKRNPECQKGTRICHFFWLCCAKPELVSYAQQVDGHYRQDDQIGRTEGC
jgi:predicted DNA-binding transcriptional regulator YafY